MVCKMLSEYNECYGDVCNSNSRDVGTVDSLKSLCRFKEGELRNTEELEVAENVEVDDLKCEVAVCSADKGEDKSSNVTCEYTDDEGDELNHLLAVYRAENYGKEGYKSADKANVGACNGYALKREDLADLQVADSVSCEGKTDDSNGRSDNYCGHDLVDPVNANELYDNSDNYVNEACKDSAEDDSCVACRSGCCAAECRKHRADECEGASEEDRAAETGEQLVNDGSHACAEERCRGAHTIADDCGNSDGCRKDRKQLLDREDKGSAEFGSVFDVVDQFHFLLPFLFLF